MQFDREITNNPEIPPSEDKRSRLSEKFNSVRSQLITSKIKTIFLVSLISFTTLLVRQTLQVQHSCNPMINWSGELSTECQIATNTSYDNFDDFSFQTQPELKTSEQQPQIAQQRDRAQPSISQNTVEPQLKEIIDITQATEPEITQNISPLEPEDEYNSLGQFVKEHSNDIVGAAAGVAGGVATVAAASATAAFSIPVAGAVAIGMGIWFLIRSAL